MLIIVKFCKAYRSRQTEFWSPIFPGTSALRDMLSNQVAVNNQTVAKNFGGQQSGGDLDRQASEKDASPEKDAPGPAPEALAEPDVEDS